MITPLRHMVQQTGNNNSRNSGDGSNIKVVVEAGKN